MPTNLPPRHHFVAATLALVLSACAFSDGDPWGSWTPSLSVTFDAESRGSLDSFTTSDDYEISIAAVSIGVQEVAVELAQQSTSAGFDPGSPPEGYSLCHNGHCHADGGALVSYDEIRAALNTDESTAVWVTRDVSTVVPVADSAVDVALPVSASGTNDDLLTIGTLARVRVTVDALTVIGVVRDLRTNAPRLNEPMPFSIEVLDAALPFTSPLDERLGNRDRPAVYTDIQLSLPASAFDQLPWLSPESLSQALSDSWSEASALRVEVTRRDL